MAEADLDAVIRQIAKAQNKSLMAAVKKRRDQIMARAAKAKDKDARDQLKHLAKSAMLHGVAAAKRLQNSGRKHRRQLRASDQIRRGGLEAGEEAVEKARQERRLKPTLRLAYERGKYRARTGGKRSVPAGRRRAGSAS